MYRTAMEKLHQWKQRANRKPMIIRGARQVGKTWLMKEFGKNSFENTVYVNFEGNRKMEQLFSIDLNVERIVKGLELHAGVEISAENTLIIFDEVQAVPLALTALKYFNENAPEYQILCAGSLLGVALHEGTSFPVGKVEFMDLYPLSFNEFLRAMGKERFADLLEERDFEMAQVFSHEYIEMLKQYYFVGGMPEVVYNFANHGDYGEVRSIQSRILDAYGADFSKHAPHEVVPRIRMVWNSIPAQLSKENKKFIYGTIREGARAKEYEMALLWLQDCGLVHRVSRVTAPNLPLKAYEDPRSFKLFILDVGLLGYMVGLNPSVLLDGNDLFKEFKGALTEQYVLQQLKTMDGVGVFTWTSPRSIAEIDFLVDVGLEIIPIEVKAEKNLKAKSLKSYCDKHKPKTAIRTAMIDYKREDWLINLPLWAIESIKDYGSQ